MTIGRHECSVARNTDFRQAIAIGLDEALTALEESFYDLDDRQMRAFAIRKHNCIAWIVVHTLQNLDEYTYQAESESTLVHDGERLRKIGLDAWIEEQKQRKARGFCYADARCLPCTVPTE